METRSKQALHTPFESSRVALLLFFSALPAVACAADDADDAAERDGGSGTAGVAGMGGSGTAASGGQGGASAVGGSGGSSRDWTYDCDISEQEPPGGCVGGYCVSCIVPASGIPFVEDIFYLVDDATTTQPKIRSEPGKACMFGTVSDIATFILGFGGEIDTIERGITQVRYTIESPPSGGIEPAAAAWGPDDPDPYWFLDTPPITTTSPVTLQLSSLDPAFDPTRMVALQFFMPAHIRTDYDFCVKDVAFLDAAGNEVEP